MPRKDSGTKGVSIPRSLYGRIEKFNDQQPEKGFTSVADFVKYAIREKLDQYDA